MDGIRESKTVNGVKHSYTTLAGKIVREAYQNTTIDYFYDNNGRPYKMVVKSGNSPAVTGYFMVNLQGDVIAIIDSDGEIAVEYQYDAWGREIGHTTSGSHGSSLYQYNALKYRGYYYDAESGFYYVSSRYYDSEVGRFISADTIDLVLASQITLTDKNLYAYCDNNPVVRRDSEGTAWETVFDIISLGSSIIEVSANPYDVGAWIGLAGDVLDVALPFVAGVGETVRAVNVGRKIADTQDDVKDVVKTVGKVHGNSLKSNRINYGYQLIDKENNVLKYGESKNPMTRYSKKWLNENGYRVQIRVAGTKKGVHEWQHDMIANYSIISGQKPKLNQSLW